MQVAMQVARLRRRVTLLTVVVLTLFAVGNAYAGAETISDGNDRPGPLDAHRARGR